jgi:hypothetical protein
MYYPTLKERFQRVLGLPQRGSPPSTGLKTVLLVGLLALIVLLGALANRSPTLAHLRVAILSGSERGNYYAVVRGLGGCAASHVEGTGPARVLRAILVGRPWVVVTVPALVLCARL